MLFKENNTRVIEIADDILEKSHPNTNYFQIAQNTLEHILRSNYEYNQLFSEFILPRTNQLGYYGIFHSSEEMSYDRGVYINKNDVIEASKYLQQRYRELGFDYAVFLCCNPFNKEELSAFGFDILFPKGFLYSTPIDVKHNEFVVQSK